MRNREYRNVIRKDIDKGSLGAVYSLSGFDGPKGHLPQAGAYLFHTGSLPLMTRFVVVFGKLWSSRGLPVAKEG